MNYEEVLLEEVIKWDVEKFNLIFKNPIIFLCGGDVTPISKPDAKLYTSLRSYLIDFAKFVKSEIEIRTAENFTDYLLYYENLLEFESDIASISDLVVVILESPGALIELGLFSGNANIFNKLVAIQHQNYSSEQSFINLGPLKALKDSSENSVLDYKWPLDRQFEKLDEDILKLICNDISEHLKSTRTQSKFDIHIDSHLILFIYEIVRCFFPITEKEIITILHLLYGSKIIGLKKLHKIIYLLGKFDLIGRHSLSSTTFIYPLDQNITKVKLTYAQLGSEKKSIFEYLRLRVSIASYIQLDTKRALALKEIKEIS